MNAVTSRIELAEADRQIAVQTAGQKGAADRAEVPCETVGQKAETIAGKEGRKLVVAETVRFEEGENPDHLTRKARRRWVHIERLQQQRLQQFAVAGRLVTRECKIIFR